MYTGKQQAFVFPDYELGDDKSKDVRLYERTHQRSKKKAVQTQTDGGDISKYSKASAETEQEETEVETETQVEASGIRSSREIRRRRIENDLKSFCAENTMRSGKKIRTGGTAWTGDLFIWRSWGW